MQFRPLPASLDPRVREWAEALRAIAVATRLPTLGELAGRLNFAPSTLSRYLAGERPEAAYEIVGPLLGLVPDPDRRRWAPDRLAVLSRAAAAAHAADRGVPLSAVAGVRAVAVLPDEPTASGPASAAAPSPPAASTTPAEPFAVPGPQAPVSPAPPRRRRPRRRLAVVAAGGVVTGIVVAGAVVATRPGAEPKPTGIAYAANRAAHAEYYRRSGQFVLADDRADSLSAILQYSIDGKAQKDEYDSAGRGSRKTIELGVPPVQHPAAKLRYRVCVGSKRDSVPPTNCGDWITDLL
jgi:hypothetical protein